MKGKIVIALYLLSGLLFSCVNDLDSIRKITFKASDPDERTTNLEVFYTDSGYARVQVFAKLAETYSKPESVIKLKDSVKINFFSENGKIIYILTALYGEIHQERGMIFVRDSVQLYNFDQKKRLETEELRWNQKDSTIFTDRNMPVTIRSEDALLFGKGIRFKLGKDFDSGDFYEPQGTINIHSQL